MVDCVKRRRSVKERRREVKGTAFKLKVATIISLPLQQQGDNKDSYRDRGDASISRISAAFQLLIVTSADEVMD